MTVSSSLPSDCCDSRFHGTFASQRSRGFDKSTRLSPHRNNSCHASLAVLSYLNR
jgi:hypothetical protein